MSVKKEKEFGGLIGVGPAMNKSFFDEYPNCCVCEKVCYTAEQILVGDKTFHYNDECWSCGVLSEPKQGCGKRLDRNPNSFHLQLGLPYCSFCFDALFLEGYGTKANVLERPSEHGEKEEVPVDVQQEIGAHASAVFRMSAPADDGDDEKDNASPSAATTTNVKVVTSFGAAPKPENKFAFLGGGADGNKCPCCKKTVYKMEEHAFEGVIWHKLCFTCGGGVSELGCKRVLAHGDYKAQAGVAFCNPCFARHFMTAGARGAVLITASTSSANTSEARSSSSGEASQDSSGMTLAERSAAFRIGSSGSSKESSVPARRDSKLMNLGSALDSNKCPCCKKTVYKMEEHAFEGVIWHKLCFTCGGGVSELGCKRVLAHGDYKAQAGVAFCNPCFARHFMTAGARGAMLVTASGAIETRASIGSSSGDAADVAGLSLSDRSSAFRGSESGRRPSGNLANLGSVLDSNKCPCCKKTVYLMEELKFEGASWHKLCFTCGGGVSELGCKRVLAHGDYKAQAGVAFCPACFARHFQKAGARGSMLITSSGSLESVEKTPSTDGDQA